MSTSFSRFIRPDFESGIRMFAKVRVFCTLRPKAGRARMKTLRQKRGGPRSEKRKTELEDKMHDVIIRAFARERLGRDPRLACRFGSAPTCNPFYASGKSVTPWADGDATGRHPVSALGTEITRPKQEKQSGFNHTPMPLFP